jgi:hypothetical protein
LALPFGSVNKTVSSIYIDEDGARATVRSPIQNFDKRANGAIHAVDGGGNLLLAPLRLAVMNFVSVVIDEARDGAVGPDGPPGPDVQESHGIEIQRIRVLPVDAEITADVFAVGPDSHPPAIIDVSHSGAVAARLLRRKLPALAFVEGIRSNAGRALGILIIAPGNNDGLFVRASDGKDSRGGVAVGDGCFRDAPGAPRVRGVEDAGGRAAGAEKNVVAGER